eukprot:9929619-Ditylum_brightwellii.AAC.1
MYVALSLSDPEQHMLIQKLPSGHSKNSKDSQHHQTAVPLALQYHFSGESPQQNAWMLLLQGEYHASIKVQLFETNS